MNTNDPMTQEQLDAIRERLEVRTSGPWRAIICESADHPPHGNGVIASGSSWPVVDDETMRAEDADLIAHAPQDLADLLAEVERLRALTTVDEAMVKRATHAIAAHWHDMHTNGSLGRQEALAIAALEAALGTEVES